MYEHRDDIHPEPHYDDRRNDRLQRGLMYGLIAAVVITLIAAVPGILLDRDTKDTAKVKAFFTPATTTTSTVPVPAAGDTTPPAPAAPATTTPAGVVTPLNGKPVQTGTATTTTPVTPAPRVCRNSYDPACGAFRWDPPPGENKPLVVSVSPAQQQATAGSTVKFTVVADDPDASIDKGCVAIDWGDGTTENSGPCPPPPSCQTPYGPWTPPARTPDHDMKDFLHKYDSPRSDPYIASFRYQTQPSCQPNPYGGVGTGVGQVRVTSAP